MKSYDDQYCPIACALGLVGERWTLLVVRELTRGPKRYTDLAEHLPGIGTNILAARLKELEGAGLVAKRKLPPPAPATVYELTASGRALKPVLHALARFGAQLMGPPPPGALEPGWLLGALDVSLAPLCSQATVAFRIGEEEASLVRGEVVPGVAPEHDVLVEADAAGFYHLVVDRRLDGVRIEGDREVLERLLDGFAPSEASAPLPA